MKYSLIHRFLLRSALVAIVVVTGIAAVSCISDADPCADEPQPVPEVPARVGDMWLSVDLRNMETEASRASASRVAEPEDGDKHPEEEASAAENYVNTSDLNIMLLDNNRRVIRTFNRQDYQVIRQADGVYRLTLKVHTDYFAYAGTAPADMVDFSLLIIANLNGIAGADGAFGDSYRFNTIEELSATYRGFSYSGLIGEISPWIPSLGTVPRLIPMAGVAAMSVKRAEINEASTSDKALALPDIYIQRSMAKVRLVDALASTGNTRYSITNVTFTGFNRRGTYLPLLKSNSDWAKETSVVEYGTALPAWWDGTTELPASVVEYKDVLNLAGFGADKVYDAFNVYVPEFSWAALGADARGPELHIQVKDSTTGELRNYTYAFPRNDMQISGGDADFARNHIYQVVVTGVKTEDTPQDVKLQLQYAVCPWSVHDIDIPPFN